MANPDLENRSVATVEDLSGIEVDGISTRDLYEAPIEISRKVDFKTLAYSSCQSCVFNQCNYART